MNKHYIIWPVLMVAAFIAYYIPFEKKARAEEAAEAAEVARLAEEKEAEKLRLQKLAAEENLKRAEEKAQEEAMKLAEKRRIQFEKDEKVRQDTAAILASVEELSMEKGKLEADLAETRRARLKMESEVFEEARAVELAKVSRRNAELDIQRTAGIIAARVDASSLVEMPIFPDEEKKK